MWFFVFVFVFFLTEAGSRRKAGVMGSSPAFRLLPIVLVKKKH